MGKSGTPGWPPASIRQRINNHQELEDMVRTLNAEMPDAVERALTRYLVVRSAGLVEAVRDDATDLHCQRVGSPRLYRRVSSGLRSGQGVRPRQLVDYLATFDLDWRSELEQFLSEDDSRRSDDLGALVNSRKKIAHGDGDQVTSRNALQWSQTALEVAKWLVDRFDPN